MKHANDTQWSVIDQQEQGGIYEYVCRNGYKLKATDVYDWTGLVGTYSDGKIEFADNGAVGGPYTLQGYCWVAFDSDGNPVGRADAVIPVTSLSRNTLRQLPLPLRAVRKFPAVLSRTGQMHVIREVRCSLDLI